MTALLQKAASTTTRIAQECLRLLAGLLRECPEWAPTTGQLRFLITWALSDVEVAAAGVGAFTLLRSVIKRKLLLPEVYDVMSKVQDLVIRAQVHLHWRQNRGSGKVSFSRSASLSGIGEGCSAHGVRGHTDWADMCWCGRRRVIV